MSRLAKLATYDRLDASCQTGEDDPKPVPKIKTDLLVTGDNLSNMSACLHYRFMSPHCRSQREITPEKLQQPPPANQIELVDKVIKSEHLEFEIASEKYRSQVNGTGFGVGVI